MAILLQTGLADLSRELGESATNSSTSRINHYNDAVIIFAGERKWNFLVKKNEDLITQANTKAYTIPSAVLANWRSPGAIKAIHIGTAEYKPIDWEDRNDSRYSGKNYFYIDPEETQITFMADLGAAGQTITIHYYYIPARTSDTTNGSFPVPDRWRKAVATLSAAFVQFSRYLSAEGSRLLGIYNNLLKMATSQDMETHRFKPRNIKHFLQYRGFKRSYP